MPGARVRALYDADAVLRRLARVLRELVNVDADRPPHVEGAARTPAADPVEARVNADGPEAVLLQALERSRDTLAGVARVLAARDRVGHVPDKRDA
jgi:hypothetical protein